MKPWIVLLCRLVVVVAQWIEERLATEDENLDEDLEP